MDYTIEKIIERLSEPQHLKDPAEINTLQSYLNGHITDLEEEEWGRQLVASTKHAKLVNDQSLSAAKAEVLWKISDEYRLWKGLERTIKKLKRYRSDLKDRFSVVTGTRPFIRNQ